ncbi:MAG: MFS transporter [Solirubrobacteraceae bacterium]
MSQVAPRGTGTRTGTSAAEGLRGRASLTARLDRIPVWPYERKLLWVVGAGYFFAFFDIVTISFAAPVIATQFHVSKATVTLSVTSSLIGYIIGAFADSTIADKWGRKLSLAVSVAVFSLGTVLAATSTNVTGSQLRLGMADHVFDRRAGWRDGPVHAPRIAALAALARHAGTHRRGARGDRDGRADRA